MRLACYQCEHLKVLKIFLLKLLRERRQTINSVVCMLSVEVKIIWLPAFVDYVLVSMVFFCVETMNVSLRCRIHSHRQATTTFYFAASVRWAVSATLVLLRLQHTVWLRERRKREKTRPLNHTHQQPNNLFGFCHTKPHEKNMRTENPKLMN